MSMRPGPDRRRRSESLIPLSFKLWFAFCALLGLAAFGALLLLVLATIGYLNRH